jgi:hypothetical protein
VPQRKAADEPDIRIEPYVVPNIAVTWDETEEGVWTISFMGEHTVSVTETATETGIVYTSPAFRGKKPGELKDSLRTAIVNSLNAAFLDAWRKKYPPDRPTKASLEYETAAMRQELEELRAEMEAAGLKTKKA